MGAGHNRRRHRRQREALWAAWAPGDLCGRCGDPTRAGDPLDADHTGTPSALDYDAVPNALSHRACNTYAGGCWGAIRRGQTPKHHSDPRLERVRLGVLAEARALGVLRAPATTQGKQSRAW